MTVWVKEHKRSMTAREYRIRNITLSLFISRSPYLLRDLCIFLIRRNMFDQPILQSPELSARYIWHQSRQLHMHRTPPPTHNSYCNPLSTSRCGGRSRAWRHNFGSAATRAATASSTATTRRRPLERSSHHPRELQRWLYESTLHQHLICHESPEILSVLRFGI
jgi:hypothetical protein